MAQWTVFKYSVSVYFPVYINKELVVLVSAAVGIANTVFEPLTIWFCLFIP